MSQRRCYQDSHNPITSTMSYPHHKPPYLPLRLHSTPPQHLSFTVDRSTTVHTVFAMFQLDGSCESKAARTATIPSTIESPRPGSTHPARSDTQHRPKPTIRERFANLFASKKRTKKNPNDVNHNTDDGNSKAEKSNCSGSMRTLSSHATDLEPQTRPKAKNRKISFRGRKSAEETPRPCPYATTSISVEATTTPGGVPVSLTDIPNKESHVATISAPKQTTSRKASFAGLSLPLRRDSVAMWSPGMPGSPTKMAALTSHPIFRIDTADSYSGEEFKTPETGRSVDYGKG